MRRLFVSLAFLLAAWISIGASTIHSIRIGVSLEPDGDARVTEVWDVTQTEGTEWYLQKSGLDGITIRDFGVTDETGTVYVLQPSWDIDRSLREKAGKCGIVPKRNGVELCWGLGSYGHHVFTVTYTMAGAVESFIDYDGLHIQFVSPGLSSRPEEVSLTLSAEGQTLSEENCRVWGFGYVGTTAFSDGRVTAASTERFRSDSSLILLLRFDKGMFSSPNEVDGLFSDRLEQAMEGADFGSDEPLTRFEKILMGLLSILFLGFPIWIGVWIDRLHKKNYLGVKRLKDVDWCRDVPYKGDILESNYVLSKVDPIRDSSVVAGAMILRMIQHRQLEIQKDARERVEIAFNPYADLASLSSSERMMFDMMKEASGSDQILQDKEFSRWSRRHPKQIEQWMKAVGTDAEAALHADGYWGGIGKLSTAGQTEARKLIGFKKFLKDFTLVDERHSAEVALWNDYLVFGTLFGIADQVAKELKDIDPKVFAETVYADPVTARQVMYMTRNLSTAITNARVSSSARAAGGFGGGASFGGGGGFHGGGFGGGAR